MTKTKEIKEWLPNAEIWRRLGPMLRLQFILYEIITIYYNQTIPKIITQIFTLSNIRETFTQLSFWEREEMKKIELNKMSFKTEKVNWYWVN